jgi:hypothetical protein
VKHGEGEGRRDGRQLSNNGDLLNLLDAIGGWYFFGFGVP